MGGRRQHQGIGDGSFSPALCTESLHFLVRSTNDQVVSVPALGIRCEDFQMTAELFKRKCIINIGKNDTC
jgi:hypothetical protein